MTTNRGRKLNHLLQSLPAGIVLTSKWLQQQGYSLDLQAQYKRSGWFNAIGTGAMIRAGDNVDYLGGIYALQSQLNLSIHPAAKTALSMQGKAHYLNFSTYSAQVFSIPGNLPPLWFKNWNWEQKIEYTLSTFLPSDIGLVEIPYKNFKIKVSHPARALMECLYLAPELQSLIETYELMENLNDLRPALVQSLLEVCNSIKVKRLFIYLAEKAGHEWLNYIDMTNIDLGTGKRAIVKNGKFIPKYQITIPKELEELAITP